MDGRPVHLEFMPLNLASIQSTMDFVAAFKEKSLPLHILVNNAGIAWVPQSMLLLLALLMLLLLSLFLLLLLLHAVWTCQGIH